MNTHRKYEMVCDVDTHRKYQMVCDIQTHTESIKWCVLYGHTLCSRPVLTSHIFASVSAPNARQRRSSRDLIAGRFVCITPPYELRTLVGLHLHD